MKFLAVLLLLSNSISVVNGDGHGGACVADDSVDSSIQITAYNTFQDAVDTQGAEMIWDEDGPNAMSDGVEFVKFPSNPPDRNSADGFYDIDFTKGTITYTLMNNSAASHLVFPDGSFDRYYFNLGVEVESAEIVANGTTIASNVTVLPPGFNTTLIDPFETGIVMPTFPMGGILVEVGPGANITELGQHIVVCYTLKGMGMGGMGGMPPGKTEGACGEEGVDSSISMTAYNTFQDATDTQGAEMIWDEEMDVAMSDGIEFAKFPSNPPDRNAADGFYDIDFSTSSITYTLMNNSAASHLVFPDGSFDRYYFNLGAPVASASIVAEKTTIASNVSVLEPGFNTTLIDPFETGIVMPTFEHGGILVEVGPGANLTELGQHIVVCYSLAEMPVSGEHAGDADHADDAEEEDGSSEEGEAPGSDDVVATGSDDVVEVAEGDDAADDSSASKALVSINALVILLLSTML